MPDSLIEIFEQRRSVPSVEKIDYPRSGASYLKQIEEDHFWFVVRRHLVRDLLRRFAPSPQMRGLDLGCGTGFTAVWLSEQGISTYGIDAYPSFFEYQQGGRGAGFAAGDIFSLDPAEEFDFVLLLDVLEHIDDDVAFLAQALKGLKPGGIGIITVPAFRWLWSKTDELSQHYRRYDLAALQHVVKEAAPNAQTLHWTYFYTSTLPLFLISRWAARFRRVRSFEDQTEANPGKMLNGALRGLLDVERRIARSVSLPLGSSLVYVLRK